MPPEQAAGERRSREAAERDDRTLISETCAEMAGTGNRSHVIKFSRCLDRLSLNLSARTPPACLNLVSQNKQRSLARSAVCLFVKLIALHYYGKVTQTKSTYQRVGYEDLRTRRGEAELAS